MLTVELYCTVWQPWLTPRLSCPLHPSYFVTPNMGLWDLHCQLYEAIRKNNFLHWLDMDPSSHTFTDFVYVYLIATKKWKRKIGHTWSFLWIVSRDLFAPRTIFPLTHNGADFKVHAMSFAIYSGKIHCAYLDSSDKCYSTRKYPMRILNHCVTPLSKTLWQILNDYYSGWMPNTFCYVMFFNKLSLSWLLFTSYHVYYLSLCFNW